MASSLPLLVMVLLSQEPCCLPCLAQENYNSVVLKAASEMDLHTLQDKIDATFDPGMLGMGFIKRCKDAKIESVYDVMEMEDEQRNVLLPMVERCTEVITQNTNVMERLEKALDDRFTCPLKKPGTDCPHQ